MNLRNVLLAHARQLGTFAGLILLCVVFTILSPYFLTGPNLLNIVQQTSINAIIAVGMTVVIITAGIDLSVGSILAFAGVVMASVLESDWPVAVAIPVGLAVGSLCGAINGALVTLGRLPPFIATLGMMSIARGGALLFTGGSAISGFDDRFRVLGTAEVLYIPVSAIIMVGVYVGAHLLMTRTRFGLYAYAMGGNEQATRLSGINVRWYKLSAYVLSGLTSGIAAIILTARLNSAQPIAGVAYELDAIAATVIGGTSLMGGLGSLPGTLIGALIIGVLRNGLNILNVSSHLQQVIIGSVIILAVLVDTFLKAPKK